KQPGDAVAVDEPIASLETDKVAVEVPSPVAGVMGEHKVQVGDTVEVGTVIATVGNDTAAGESTTIEPREQPKAESGQEAGTDEEPEELPKGEEQSDLAATLSPS